MQWKAPRVRETLTVQGESATAEVGVGDRGERETCSQGWKGSPTPRSTGLTPPYVQLELGALRKSWLPVVVGWVERAECQQQHCQSTPPVLISASSFLSQAVITQEGPFP